MNTEKPQNSRTLKDYAGITARGFAMGCADVVPGVSGGTMAFILGIYEELVDSIRMFTMPDTIKTLLRLDVKQALIILPWRFLLALGLGIATAIVTMARPLEWLLEHHPVYLWSFFFGLIIASIIVVRVRVESWNIKTVGGLLIGTIVGYLIVTLTPVETPNQPWFLFLSGVIAICAMILPGISGSFLLVILGKYQQILSAVNDFDFLTLIWVALGAGVGIVSFAQVVGWLFKNYSDMTISVLIGLMAGSLWKIWPWKNTLETFTKPSGEIIPLVQENIIPAFGSEVVLAIILAIIGFGLVVMMERLANKPDTLKD
jgi:putative membrane protein